MDVSSNETKLQQYCNITHNLEKQIKEFTVNLNSQELYISTLDTELKKLYTEIQMKSNSIESESKQLESLKNKQEASRQYLVKFIFLIHFLHSV